jgi:signal peptidase I
MASTAPTTPSTPTAPTAPTTPKANPFWREAISYALLFGAILLTRASFADQYTVPSGSMLPTVQLDDRVLVEKCSYGLRIPMSHIYLTHFSEPRRGEVVVLDSPKESMVLLKRIAAVPGDRVWVHQGQIEINGVNVPFVEHTDGLYEQAEARTHPVSLENGYGPDFGPTVVPPDKYLVLGDNRGNSNDGRYFGYVDRSVLLGRVEGIFWSHGRPTWHSL